MAPPLIAGIAAIMILSGCTALRPAATSNCGDLLGYYETVSLMDSDRRKQVLKTADEFWTLTHQPCDQLRLALLLSRPDNTLKQRQRALRLVSDLLSRGQEMDRESRGLTFLLEEQLKQFQTRQVRINKLGHQLKQEAGFEGILFYLMPVMS